MKQAYWSSDYKPQKPLKDIPIGISDSDSATENAGRNGWNLLERGTEPLLTGDNDPIQYLDPGKPKKEELKDSLENKNLKKILDKIINLADDMDKNEEYLFADFADYLIIKFSELNDYSYINQYKDLMLKINNSDLTDRNETIKKLTNIYSRTLIMEFSKNKNINKSHEYAFLKTLHRANQYLSKDSGTNPQLKEAQTFATNNPILVAKQIKGIIDVMVGRMSPEAQMRAYPNLKGKIRNLNISELNSKKSPGGASIGISITLVKNILNGRDPMFISAVINELSKHL